MKFNCLTPFNSHGLTARLMVWAVNSWTHNFNLTQDQLKKVFPLPHEVAFAPYLKAFQYKVLNSILFTNKKLCKIGYT